jgi:predicted nucleotidyltransferase component of viral defense system
MSRSPSNVAHSVHARLKNAAREKGRPFNEILQRYGMERFLYRFSQTAHAAAFTLKGALMLQAHNMTLTRPTRDIDVLGTGAPDSERLECMIRDCCTAEVEGDGITFDLKSISSQPIRADARYEGQRLSVMAYLRKARIPIQVDVGFGDVVVPAPVVVDYPTILDFEPPRLRAYTFESAVAEKYEAMVELGAFNSRMKDFYDIWWLSQHHSFRGSTLGEAVSATFERRKTPFPDAVPVALTSSFVTSRTEAQWTAFYKKLHVQPSRSGEKGLSLTEVTERLHGFLWPLTRSLHADATPPGSWPPGGPWHSVDGSTSDGSSSS